MYDLCSLLLYTEQSKAVPRKPSVWWTNQTPLLPTVGQSSLHSRTSSRVGRLSNMCCNNYFSARTAVVEVTREHTDEYALFTSGPKRHAKVLAAIRMNRGSSSLGRSLQYRSPSSSRSRTCAKNRRVQASHSLVTQQKTTPSSRISPLHSSQLTTTSSHSCGAIKTLQHVQLKDFSIRLERIPVKKRPSGSSRDNAIVID